MSEIYRHSRRNALLLIALAIVLVIAFIVDILFGSLSISIHEVFNAIVSPTGSETDTVILKFRIPKALTALVAGIALSVSGLQMQTVFRNPMAGPYVLGISSGASLGVALVILGFSSFFPAFSSGTAANWAIIAAAWAGAGAVLLIIMAVSARIRDIMTILVLGIMLSSGISAIVVVLQYFSSETMLKAYVVWTMGSLGNLTADQLMIMSACVMTGLVSALLSVKRMNALLLGENYATSLGVNVRRARLLIFAGTSILAGSVTAYCGPIGFIGIAVPHIARMIFRTSDHRVLLPGVILIGSTLLLVSDMISQVAIGDAVLPVNAITSFIGIPVVIWVVVSNRKYSGVF